MDRKYYKTNSSGKDRKTLIAVLGDGRFLRVVITPTVKSVHTGTNKLVIEDTGSDHTEIKAMEFFEAISKPWEESLALVDILCSCRKCGCTNEDCSQCIEKTGQPCYWAEPDLCSACVEGGKND